MRKSGIKYKCCKFNSLGDPRFGDPLVQKFVNKLMHHGKKYVAYNIFYSTIEQLSDIVNNESIQIKFDIDDTIEHLYKNINNAYIDIEKIKDELSKNSVLKIFIIALRNVVPNYEIKRRRFGAQTVLVPVQIGADKGVRIAISSIISSARKGPHDKMVDNLRNEIFLAYNKEGLSYKKKEENEKLVDVNPYWSSLKV